MGGRSEGVLDGLGAECIKTPDLYLWDNTAPLFYNDKQSNGGHDYTPVDTKLGLDGQGATPSLSTPTFVNSHSWAPSISTQSSHKCTASTSRPPQSILKQGYLKAFKVETDTCELHMVELASKQQDYKMASLAVKKKKEITGTWEHEKEHITAEECQLAAKERM
jgi:hypothetical protein